MTSKTPVGRNAPCPCGSGKSFRQCCEGRPAGRSNQRFLTIGLTIILLGLVALVARMELSSRTERAATIDLPIAVAAPWTYDAANDRHWNPLHGHWHPGPPPADAVQPEAAATQPGVTPEPWEYDTAKNRHWDPSPGHGHWHNGPPPPPEAR